MISYMAAPSLAELEPLFALAPTMDISLLCLYTIRSGLDGAEWTRIQIPLDFHGPFNFPLQILNLGRGSQRMVLLILDEDTIEMGLKPRRNPQLILVHPRLKSMQKAWILAAVPAPIPRVFSDGILMETSFEHTLVGRKQNEVANVLK